MAADESYRPLMTDVAALQAALTRSVTLCQAVLYATSRHDGGLARALLPAALRTVIARAQIVLARLEAGE
jgi:hypothetical protein